MSTGKRLPKSTVTKAQTSLRSSLLRALTHTLVYLGLSFIPLRSITAEMLL
jgi:hypothetical protein